MFKVNSVGYPTSQGRESFPDNFLKTSKMELQSKRPQVKTSPSQNVPELVKTSPKIGQNVPMVKKCWSKRPQNDFYYIFYVILGIIWDD